jgi:mRNA-degrading endonuclease RelE of RelBE toxin-antitoxin system
MCEDPFGDDVKSLRGENALRRKVGDWRILFELGEKKTIIFMDAVKRRGSNTY